MSKEKHNCLAIDCGNSSICIVLGTFDGKMFHTTLVEQTAHRETIIGDVWHWDIIFIFDTIKRGIRKAFDLCGHIHSAGISTWGIDHGLLGAGDFLLANPLCYRNSFGQHALEKFSTQDRREMFVKTGIQCDKINSIFQMLGYREAYPDYWRAARGLLLIPDLLNFILTGEKNSDASITSTTQLYDVTSRDYSAPILDKFAFDRKLFPELIRHGQPRGTLRKEIADELQINQFPIMEVPAHDTAAAVAAIPVTNPADHPLFISSGTWSLIGAELDSPLINDAVHDAGLTNESGILDTTTLLKNSAGLFIAQRLKMEYDLADGPHTWNEIVRAIEANDPECGIIDPNAAELFNPPSMKAAICGLLADSGQKIPTSFIDAFRIVYESLAHSYQSVIADLERVTAKHYPAVNVIGGGSQNRLLNAITARVTGKQVIAGPTEATALGTLGTQLLFAGVVDNLSDIRKIMRASCETTEFTGD